MSADPADVLLILMTAGLIAACAWEGLDGRLRRVRPLALGLVALAAYGALQAISSP